MSQAEPGRRPGSVVPRPLARLIGRAGWNLADQVLSSGTNAVLAFLVARSVSESAFGGFAVAFTVFAVLVGLVRALATSPLGIRFSDADDDEFRRAGGAAAGSALGLGLVAGVATLGAGLLVGGPAGAALIALAGVLPGLLVQDAWRYVFFAAGRPGAATANDAFWAVLQIGTVAVLLAVGVDTAWPLILSWGLSAAAASVLGIRQARTFPRPRAARRWIAAHRDLTRWLVAEYMTLQGAQQGALLLIAVVGSLEAIGALRAVQVLLGPTTILAVAGFSFAVPELARRRASMDAARARRAAGLMSGAVALLGLAWGLLFVVLPGQVGQELLGETWAGTSAILWPTLIGQFGAALGCGPAAVLYALDRASVTFAVHAIEAPLIFLGGVGGVLLAGAWGAAVGFAIAFWVGLPVLWFRLITELRRRDAAPR